MTYNRHIVHTHYDHPRVLWSVFGNSGQPRFQDMLSVEKLLLRGRFHPYTMLRVRRQEVKRGNMDFEHSLFGELAEAGSKTDQMFSANASSMLHQ